MNAESISYCCTGSEWETMRQLLRLELPLGWTPGRLTKEELQGAMESLTESGILTPEYDEMMADRLFAFLLTETCGAASALIARAERKQVLLSCGQSCAILTEWAPSGVAITPFQGPATAGEALQRAVKKLGCPVVIELLSRDGVLDSRQADEPESAQEALQALHTRLCAYLA